jgi:PAS domain S-box-containing protein
VRGLLRELRLILTTVPRHPLSDSDSGSLDKVTRDVLDSLLEGCQVIGFDWTYLYINDAAARQGQSTRAQLVGRTMMECYPGIDTTPMFSVLRRSMSERRHDRMETEFPLPDGSKGWFELRFVPVPAGVCILSLDITEEKRSAEALRRVEDQLRQAQKMEAVGRLAGGVAHDFNNILSVILGYSDFVLEELKPGDPMRSDVEEIKKAGSSGADLTRQLLMFSRQQVLAPKVADLNEILGGMDKMLQRILGADVDLVSLFAPALGRVRVDPGSIEQVIMNLVVNARDAMPTGGALTMETGNVDLDAAYARTHVGVTPGPHVMLAVTDTGAGMDEATTTHMFEPFFTTKEKGKGTGLGLSTVFGIVQQHGGSIWVYSEPGNGTAFKIYLPRVDAPADVFQAAAPPASLNGSETILLAEDDNQVRAVALAILRRRGYQVIEAHDAREALLQSEKHSGTIHLLLSDVVMPEMSGPELATRLASVRPDMKVLCMSGYTDDSITRHGVIDADVAYVQKPFTADTLTTKVREVLDATSRRLTVPAMLPGAPARPTSR